MVRLFAHSPMANHILWAGNTLRYVSVERDVGPVGLYEMGDRYVFQKKRKAITAKENGCGRFAVSLHPNFPGRTF